MDYYTKYLKYKKKYLDQKGGTSDARIEERRQNQILSFARVHPATDIVLQIGQKYVFQRMVEQNQQERRLLENRFINGLEYSFEVLEYLGQKKIRNQDYIRNFGRTDKRRPQIENRLEIYDNATVVFTQMHAFKKNNTGEVLMLDDDQILDQICL